MTGIQSFRPREERLRDIVSCQCLLMSGTVWVKSTSTKDKQRQEATFHREEGRLRQILFPASACGRVLEQGNINVLTVTHSKRKQVLAIASYLCQGHLASMFQIHLYRTYIILS